MRKKVLMIISAACVISGCAVTKTNKQTTLRASSAYNTSIIIPPGKSSNSVMMALSQIVATDNVFPDMYSRGKNIEGLDIASVKIESSDPSKRNLGMFKSIKMYLSNGNGSNEVLIASSNGISQYAGIRLSLNVDFDKTMDLGYATINRKDVTGAMASMNSEGMDGTPVTRADQAMVGKLAGVRVRKNGGPGAASDVIVRGGATSLATVGSPVYIVDGVPVDNLSMINPNDIESIDVLKDPSLTSMYSHGSNGVVIVTTKRGNSEVKANAGSLDNLVKGPNMRVRLEYVLRNPLRSETGLKVSIDFK